MKQEQVPASSAFWPKTTNGRKWARRQTPQLEKQERREVSHSLPIFFGFFTNLVGKTLSGFSYLK